MTKPWSAVYAEDSKGYLLVADFYMGRELSAQDIPLMKYRLFSPVIPFAASILGKFLGIPAAFLCINFILWNFSALILYELLNLLLKHSYTALVGTAIFTTSLPVIEWGLPVMVVGRWAGRPKKTAGGGSQLFPAEGVKQERRSRP